MSSMRRPKGIVHIELGELRELLGKSFVVFFLLSVETKIFQQKSLALLKFERHFFGFFANTLGTETNVFSARQFFVQQHAKAFGNRLEAQFWIRLAFWASQVRSEDEARAVP